MLTKLIENGRVKANSYLPESTSETLVFGDSDQITVKLKEENVINEDIVVKMFTLTKNNETKEYAHIQYTGWPDHGVPDVIELLQLMETITKQKSSISTTQAPTIIHCSAGIGRTGAYVIISSTIKVFSELMKKSDSQIPSSFKLNIMKNVEEIRNMRSGMLTSLEQYKFCYQAIIHYLQPLVK